MAGELGEAIGLQGSPRIETSRQIKDILGLKVQEEQQAQKRFQFEQEQERKKQAEHEKLIKPYITIDYDTIHPVFKQDALNLVSEYTGQINELKSNRDPIANSQAHLQGQRVVKNISDLKAKSDNLFGFSKYYQEGGFLSPEDEKIVSYVETGNPMFIKYLDLTKTAAVKAFDPQTKEIIWEPFQYFNPVAYASKNYYKTTKEQVAGRDGRFDRVAKVYNKDDAKSLALQDFDSNPTVQKMAEYQFKADVFDELSELIDPITGEKRYPVIDGTTLQDPSFQEDYDEMLREKWGNFSSSLPLTQSEKLVARPQPKATKSSAININLGSDPESVMTQLGFAVNQEDYYNYSSVSPQEPFTNIYSGGTQPVKFKITSGGQELFNVSSGAIESVPSANDYTSAELILTPVYKSGANKGKPVPNSKLEADKDLYEYTPSMKLVGTSGTGLLTQESTYFTPLQKVKSAYLLGLSSEDEKESEQNRFSVLEQEAKRLNNSLKQEKKTSQTPATPQSKNKAPRPR